MKLSSSDSEDRSIGSVQRQVRVAKNLGGHACVVKRCRTAGPPADMLAEVKQRGAEVDARLGAAWPELDRPGRWPPARRAGANPGEATAPVSMGTGVNPDGKP